MLSKEDLVRIIRDKLGEHIIKDVCCGETYYILLDGRIVSYEEANDIYAELSLSYFNELDRFIYFNNYLAIFRDIVYDYIRKAGFTIGAYSEVKTPPAPNLKYYITAYAFYNGKSKYLDITVYDIDAVANSLGLPRLVQQELGVEPREIGINDVENIISILAKQPLLAGYTLSEAGDILDKYYLRHKKKYKDKAYKITLAYTNLFPTPYEVCYEWKAGILVKIDCLKILLHPSSS